MKTLFWALIGLCLCAGMARPQYVDESLDVGGRAVGSLAYNSSAGVVYGCSQETYYFFAISCDSHKVISRIYRDMPMYIAYASRVNKVYFTQRTDDIDSVIVVDGTAHRYLKGIPLLWATVPVYDSVSNRLYVSCDGENEVGVIDCATDSVIARIHVGSGPVWMDLNAQGRKLYTRNDDGESVSIIDLETNTVIRTIRLGGVPSAGCFSAAVNKYYCGINGIVVVDGAGDTVVARVDLPLGCAVNSMVAVGSVVLAGLSVGNQGWVYAVDAVSDTVVSTLRVGREALSLVSSQRSGLVYVADAVDDDLYVITPDGSRVLAIVPMARDPFALQPVAPLSQIYVGHLGSSQVYIVRDSLTGVSEPAVCPYGPLPTFAATPNPFSSVTTIRCVARHAASAEVHIVSSDGRLLRRLVSSGEPSGAPTTYVWDGRDESGKRVPGGVYIAVFEGQTDGHVKLTKSE
jgi:YVTN family beta-propeller protein